MVDTKKDDNKVVGAILKSDLKVRFEKICEKNHRSVSSTVNMLISEYVEKEDRVKK